MKKAGGFLNARSRFSQLRLVELSTNCGVTSAPQLRSSISTEMMPLSPGVEGQPEATVGLVLLTGGHHLCPSAEKLAGPHAFLGGKDAPGQSAGP